MWHSSLRFVYFLGLGGTLGAGTLRIKNCLQKISDLQPTGSFGVLNVHNIAYYVLGHCSFCLTRSQVRKRDFPFPLVLQVMYGSCTQLRMTTTQGLENLQCSRKEESEMLSNNYLL